MANQIEYVSKVIYQVTSNLRLKHQVKLGKKDQKGKRRGAVFKYDFDFGNYEHEEKLSSLTIDSSDYLILEYNDKETRENIFISYPHMYNFKRILKESVKWFYSEKYNDMYIYANDEIKFNSKYKNLRLETDITIDRKSLVIKPAIVSKNDLFDEGVIIFLNGQDAIASLDVSELEELYNTVNDFDLYNSSLILTHYVLTSHPESILCNMNNNYSSTKEKIPKVDEFQRKRKKKSKPE